MVERPKITQHVLGIISTKMDEQNEKGFEKYNMTIDDAKDDDYVWLEMALEEVLDCVQYLMKENMNLRKQLKENGRK